MVPSTKFAFNKRKIFICHGYHLLLPIQYSKIFFFAILSFIFGVFVASFLVIPKFIVWEVFILGIAYCLLFLTLYWQKLQSPGVCKLLRGIALGLCLIFFGLGILRTINFDTKLDGRLFLYQNLQGVKLLATTEDSYFSAIKNKMREAINANLPNPQNAILSGILLGDKASFSKEWKQKLSNTGTSHIVAVSGMNIVMLSSILVGFGVILGFYRNQSLWGALILIWFFIALIGFQVSAIRAGVMGSILILCQILGRQGASFRALCLAVCLMLAINPTLLRYSLSFQLSVLATLGLIQLSPIIEAKLKEIKLISILELPQVIATSLAAQIFTMPFLIYSFNSISLVGLFVNILIVPLLPIVMVLGIIFLLGALIYNPLGVVLAWPVGVLLSFVVWIIEIFSKIPFAVLRF